MTLGTYAIYMYNNDNNINHEWGMMAPVRALNQFDAPEPFGKELILITESLGADLKP